MKYKLFTLVSATFLITVMLYANVKLPTFFTNHMVLQHNMAAPIWGWADAGERVTVQIGRQTKSTTANAAGKWMLPLGKIKAGGPYTITISGKNKIVLNDVYAGEVWLCSGQSNMDMTVAQEDRYWCGVVNEAAEVAAADYPLIRVFDVDFTPSEVPANDVMGKWEIVSQKTVGHLSAVAYFFARNIQQQINMPIGLITTAYGASTAEAWVREEALLHNPECKPLVDIFKNKLIKYEADTAGQQKYKLAYKKWIADAATAKEAGKNPPRAPRNPNPVQDQHNASVLWNGMVKPLVHYAIRGVLWYQGESNSPTAKIYRQIMETLITDWRNEWGRGNFPFLYVQLANIGKTYDSLPALGGNEAIKREAQLRNLSLPNTAMAVAIDNADPTDMNNVHPKNKQDIGNRLALAAMATVYGKKQVYAGPLFTKMKVEGNSLRLYFSHVGSGLMAKGGELKGFAIAGEDKKFVWANVNIDGNTIVVSAEGITHPTSARYAWGNNPLATLYNKEGLPASPFRTDVDEN